MHVAVYVLVYRFMGYGFARAFEGEPAGYLLRRKATRKTGDHIPANEPAFEAELPATTGALLNRALMGHARLVRPLQGNVPVDLPADG
jgi:hypothetical protein